MRYGRSGLEGDIQSETRGRKEAGFQCRDVACRIEEVVLGVPDPEGAPDERHG